VGEFVSYGGKFRETAPKGQISPEPLRQRDHVTEAL
jgi:hypothetical protein